MPTDTETVAANDPIAARRARDARAAHALTLFRALFPAVFRDPPQPLAIGIHHELVAAAAGKFDRAEVEAALRSWTGRRNYRQALAAGGPRYALDGTPKGQVTVEQQQIAQQQIAFAVESRRSPPAPPVAAAVEPPVPPPVPAPAPEPPPAISPRTGRPILKLKPRSAPPATAPI